MTDSLQRSELLPVGGSWSGLLFENPAAGYPLALTWTFTIEFAQVRRDFGSASPSLTIDWVPAEAPSWQAMQAQRATCATFGGPIETSLYFFEHHRYERVELVVTNQNERTITIQVTAAGDIDALGVPELSTQATLDFAGIHVQAEDVGTDVDAARGRLAQFTDTTGLHARARTHNVLFEIA